MKFRIFNESFLEEDLQSDYEKYYNSLPQDLFLKLVSFDPTYTGTGEMSDNKGKFTRWILDRYLKKDVTESDFGHIKDCLTRFKNQQGRLEKKDINQYKTLAEIDSALNDAEANRTANQIVKDNQKAMRNTEYENDKVLSTGKWDVYVPSSYKNSCAIAHKGDDKDHYTKWCTAATDSNYYYNRYKNEYGGEYYIIINKNNPHEKYQFHFESEQFMDADDEPIDKDEFLNKNSELNNYFIKIGLVPKIVDGLKILGSKVIEAEKSIIEVVIPDDVTEIGQYAFCECTSLTSIVIPNSVKEIGYKAFNGCTSLTSVTIPNSVMKIEEEAFGHCKSLTSVVIPNGVTKIEDGTFWDCTALTSITIPNSVTKIGGGAFAGCKSLTSVTVPNSVVKIGKFAFNGCTSLTSVTIPNSVKEIGYKAFNGCTSLTSVTIPNSVMKIEEEAFCNCTSLTSITIPNSVTEIEEEAFAGCTSLTILCHKDSYAEQYAEENNIPVKLIESNQVHNNKMRFNLVEGKNLETTVNQYKDKVKKALANDRSFILDVERYKQLDGIDDPEDAAAKEWVKSILEIDPTYQEGSNTTGLYGTFILNQYIKDPDMDTIAVTELLKKFDENKRFLDNKDINSYKDWDEIIDALANKSVSARQAERIARHANSKIKKVWENENWAVYSPLNYEGALTLGRGSSWCTSDSRTAKFYVQYAVGDIHAEMDYEDVDELQDDFFEDEDHQLDLEDNGFPTTKEEILKEYSNRAVLEFYDDGFFIYNPYDLDGSDYIYDIINKSNNSIKYQLALMDGFYDYAFDNNPDLGSVIANIHDNILSIEKVVEMHPDLRAFFEDKLEIRLNTEDEEEDKE